MATRNPLKHSERFAARDFASAVKRLFGTGGIHADSHRA